MILLASCHLETKPALKYFLKNIRKGVDRELTK